MSAFAEDRILAYGTQTYVHSPAGNLESRTDGTKTLGLTYDELGNLTKVILKEGATTMTIDYVIDGFGRRVGRKVNGTFDRSWLYRDGLRPVAEVDAAGVFTHCVYADSQSGAPDFLIRSGVLYRVGKDHLGSVRLVVNATTGAIAQSLEYDAYGRILSETGAGFQPFGFAGGLYDADTKLVRFGARDYDPGMGRWTNKDPIGFAGGQTNLYVYVGNDPVNERDPSGLLDLFWQIDVDNVSGEGIERSGGGVWDVSSGQTGVFKSRGDGFGLNVGAGAGVGVAFRDIEGRGYGVDVNIAIFSLSILVDDKGWNGFSVAVGPGLGGSISKSYTSSTSH